MASPDLDASLADRLGGRWAISWQASAITIPLAIGVVALSVQASEDPLAWSLIAVAAVAVGGAWTYLMHRTLFRNRAAQPVALPVVITTTVIIALLYVGTMVALGLLLHLFDFEGAASQFLPLLVLVIAWGPLLNLVLDSQWRFRTQREELVHQAVQLQVASAQEIDVLQEVRDSVHRQIGEQVRSSNAGLIRQIEDLMNSGDAEVGTLADELRSTADQTVRPLSHELEDRARRRHRTPGPLTALANIVRYQPFRPLAVSILYAVTAPPRDVALYGATYAFGVMLVTIAFIFAIMTPLNQAMDRWPQHHASIYLAGLAVIQAPTVLLAPIREQVTGETIPSSQLLVTVVFGTILVLATSAFGSWNRTRKQVIADFQREVDEDTLATLARGEALAQATMDAALVLHGSVQSSLYACALTIDEASRRGDIVEVNRALMQARAILEAPPTQRERVDRASLRQAIDQRTAQWSGLVDLTVSTASCVDVIANPLATHVADVVEEGIANAVHHGAATAIQVEVTTDDASLMIVVTDDGRGPQGGSAGMGSRLMGRYGARWRLTKHEPGSMLMVEIPLDDDGSTPTAGAGY